MREAWQQGYFNSICGSYNFEDHFFVLVVTSDTYIVQCLLQVTRCHPECVP